MSFIPNDETIAELLEHSDLEENLSDYDVDPDPFELYNTPFPEEPIVVKLPDIWEKTPFKSKQVLEKLPVPIAEPKKPVDYFSKYIPDELFEQIAVNTKKCLESRGKCANYCTVDEIKKFFGVHALMGIVKCPRKDLYFHPKFKYGPISNSLSYEKYRQIRLSLRVVDESNPDELEKMTNRLWKVQPLIESVRFRCQQIPRDNTHYCIGDQVINFIGPHVGSKFNWKSKPIGLKNFIVTTPQGLVVDFEIYQGSLTDLPERSLGTTTAVVLRLARTLPNSSLYFGRSFTTVQLMDELIARNIDGTGIISPNKLNYDFKKNMERFCWEEVTRSDQKLCAIKWMDIKNSMILLSTVYGSKPTKKLEKYDKLSKQYDTVRCPLVLSQYKRNIIGIDLNNQIMDLYTATFKTKKWPVNIVLYLFDLSITNSYFEYKEDAKKCNLKDTLDAMSFRLAIVEELLCNVPSISMDVDVPAPTHIPTYKPPSLSRLTDRFDGKNHWIVCDKSIKSQRICRREKCKSRTNVMCSKCKVYLCFNYNKNCFYTFHNKDEKK